MILAEVLAKLPSARPCGDGYTAKCPSHDDGSASLSICEKDGKLLFRCFAGCSFTDILAALGNGNGNGGARVPFSLAVLAAAKKLPIEWLHDHGVEDYPNGKAVLIGYFDENRKQHPRQRRRTALKAKDGSSWTGQNGVSPIPYGLWLLDDARAKRQLTIVEGESDCWALWLHGYPALGLPGARIIKPLLLVHLREIDNLYVVQESDSAGAAFPGLVAAHVRKLGYKGEIRAITMPAGAKDPCDLHVAGNFEAAFSEAIGAAKPVSESASAAVGNGKEPSLAAVHGDLFLGDRFLAKHGKDVLFCPTRGWLLWDGRRWAWDEREAVVGLAKEVVRDLYREAAKIEDDKERSALVREARGFDRSERIRSALVLARTQVVAVQNELDADGWLLNCRNGAVDLRDGNLRPHDRADLATKLIDIDYLGSAAQAPRFQRFLTEIFNGDTKLIDYLQKAIGYSFTADQREQCLHFQWGAGANGKSTLMETLLKAAGDYGHVAPAELLMERKFGEAIPTDRADLAGKRFVAVNETGEGRELAEALVKTITGGDRLTARHLYQNSFTFTPTHHIWLSSNHKPNIPGTDFGIWRRIRLVPFTQRFEGAAEDKGLKAALERELPGILSWIVTGAVSWFREGRLRPPDVITAATAEYRSEQDVLAEFLRDCCVLGDGLEAFAKDLYDAYREWCGEKNPQWGSTKFGRRLAERGFAKKPRQNRVIRMGLRIRQPNEL